MTCSALSRSEFFQMRRNVRQVQGPTVKAKVMRYTEEKEMLDQELNKDQELYPDLRGNYGKALMHEASGFITPAAYQSLVTALDNESPASFDSILLGIGTVKLTNPQASLAYSLPACDSWINIMPPAPAFASAQTAGEMVELYWTVLARDVPFNQFGSDSIVADAVAELNTLSDFRGPKVGGVVTPGTFLRGNTPGDLIGPYISQFLYLDVPYGATVNQQLYNVPLGAFGGTRNCFMYRMHSWLNVISGGGTSNQILLDSDRHFLRTPRDLGEYVHHDFPLQTYLNALLILNSYGRNALDPNNPYKDNPTQDGFATFGIGQYLELLGEAVQEGLKTAWYQKWQVNRRACPEEYGFYVHKQVEDNMPLGISTELTDSDVLPKIHAIFGTYLLAQSYPEGCPTHPAYPAGHAVVAGACVTILKALFDEDFEIRRPVEPSADNKYLIYYSGKLHVGNELNKLAANISLGRDHAGVHYRSDGYDGLLLGEKVAIDILENASFLPNENFAGFELTKFDGTRITVGAKK